MECEETGFFKHELAFSKGLTVCNAQKATMMAWKCAAEWLRNVTKVNQSFSIIGVRIASARGCIGASKTFPRDFQDPYKLCPTHSKAERNVAKKTKTTKRKLAGSERNTQKVTKNAARVAKSSPRIPFCMYPFPPAPYAGTYKIF